MARNKLNATITIGGAISSSFRTAIGAADADLKRLGATVKTLRSAQASLASGKGMIDTTKLEEARRTVGRLDKLIERTRKRLEQDPGNVGLQARLALIQTRADGARKKMADLEKAHAAAEATIRKATGSTKLEANSLEKLRAAAENAERRIASLNRVKAAGAKVGAAFGQAMSDVGRAAGILGGVAAVVGGAMFGVTKSFSDAGDEIAAVSQSLGITTKALQELRYAAMHNNVPIEDMDAALTKLSATLAKAGDDGGELQQVIEELGLDLDAVELRAMGPEKSFYALADAMQDMRDPADRVRLAMALMGRNGARMVPTMAGGSKAVRELADEAHRLGYVMGEEAIERAQAMDREMKRLGAAFTGLKNTVGAELAPAFVDLFRSLKEFMVANGPAIRQWAVDFGREFKATVPAIVKGAGQIFDALKTVAVIVGKVVELTGGWKVATLAVATVISAKAIMSVAMLGKSIFSLGAALVPMIASLWGSAASIGAAATATWAWTAALLANPITWVVAAVIAAGVAIGYLTHLVWKHRDAIVEGIGVAWDWVTEKIANAITFWKEAFTGFGEWIGRFWDNTVGRIGAAWDTITGWFSDEQEDAAAAAAAQAAASGRPGAAMAAARPQASAATPLPAVPPPPGLNLPPAATSASVSGRPVLTSSNTITVNAAPGQDPKEIALQVDRLIRDRQARAANGALYD